MAVLLGGCGTKERQAGRQGKDDTMKMKIREPKLLLPIGGFDWMQE